MKVSKLLWFWGSGGSEPYQFIPIVLKLGQSNSIGFAERTRALALSTYAPKPSGVKRFVQLSYNLAGGGWMDYDSGLGFGNGSVLGKLLYDNLQTDVFIIEAGRGGSSLASVVGSNNDWNELSGSNDCYNNATAKMFTEGIAKIPNPNSLPLKVLAIEWHQGETDQAAPASYAAYATNLANMFTALRSYHALLADPPIIITRLNWAPGTGQTTINDAFDAYAAVEANNAYVIDPYALATYPWKQNLPVGIRTTYPPIRYADDNHASYETQEIKGELLYDKIVEVGVITSSPKSPTVFDNDKHVEDVLYYCANNAIAAPSSGNITALNTLFTTLKASTVFKKIIGLYLMANDSSKAFGQLNLMGPTSPTNHIYNGTTWVSDQGGIGQYFYIYGLGTFYGTEAQNNPYWFNDISMGVLVHNFTSKVHFGIRKTGTANDFYFTGNTGGSTARAFGSVTATPTITTSNKFFAISRQFGSYPNTSLEWDYYVDSTKTTVTDTRTGTTTDNAQFMRDGSALDDQRNAAAFIGYGMTEAEMTILRNALTTYKAAL